MNIGLVHSSIDQQTYMTVCSSVNRQIYRGHQQIKKVCAGSLFSLSSHSTCTEQNRFQKNSLSLTPPCAPPPLAAAHCAPMSRRPLPPPHPGVRTASENHRRPAPLSRPPLGHLHHCRRWPVPLSRPTTTDATPKAGPRSPILAAGPGPLRPPPRANLYPEPAALIADKVFFKFTLNFTKFRWNLRFILIVMLDWNWLNFTKLDLIWLCCIKFEWILIMLHWVWVKLIMLLNFHLIWLCYIFSMIHHVINICRVSRWKPYFIIFYIYKVGVEFTSPNEPMRHPFENDAPHIKLWGTSFPNYPTYFGQP
jgi:hypothetical protein